MVLKLLFGMMPLVFIFYGYFLFVILRRGRQTIFKRKFFHAVVSVLNRNAGDIKRRIPQIELNFRNLSQRYPTTSRHIKSSLESNNPQLGLTTLRSLSDTLEDKDTRIKIKARRSTTAIAVAAAGAFLTIFFGLVSFLPL